MNVISSSRIELITLDLDVLQFSLQQDKHLIKKRVDFAIPGEWYEEKDLIQFRIKQLKEDPTYLPWSTRAISLRDERKMIGYIGFHTKPADPYLMQYAPQGVEFGFVIFPSYRRNGYAREACNALMGWAHEHHNITEFIVSISPSNFPSLKLAQSLGFKKVGSHIDEIDGLEDILRLTYLST